MKFNGKEIEIVMKWFHFDCRDYDDCGREAGLSEKGEKII